MVARKPLDGTVTLLQRMSNSVRRWLGVEILCAGQLAIESRVSRIDTAIREIEAKDVERHAALSGLLNQTNEAVRKLEAALQRANAFTPAQYPDSPLPWELIEAMALEKLEQPPDPKEFQNA